MSAATRTILVPFGTRPEIVKLAPVVQSLAKAGLSLRVVATGQHADPALYDVFLHDLGMEPHVRWTLDGDDARRLGSMIESADREIAQSRPSLVLLLGDTNTVPTFCLAARRRGVPVAHLEAGLRSFNERSTEEVNRRIAAACASLHLAPTPLARRFLLSEGIPAARVRVVGNSVIDVLRQHAMEPLPVGERRGVLFTAHRATNVDDPERLRRLVDLVVGLARAIGPVTFPVHPRTKARLEEHGLVSLLDVDGVTLRSPLPYGEMLRVLAGSRLVVTDSGGLQEEASYFGVPVVVLRRSTPRWEGVAAGTSVLVGLDVDAALQAARRLCGAECRARIADASCPYGDGHTAERVTELLLEESTWELLALEEPDLTGWLPAALDGDD